MLWRSPKETVDLVDATFTGLSPKSSDLQCVTKYPDNVIVNNTLREEPATNVNLVIGI